MESMIAGGRKGMWEPYRFAKSSITGGNQYTRSRIDKSRPRHRSLSFRAVEMATKRKQQMAQWLHVGSEMKTEESRVQTVALHDGSFCTL